MPASTTLTIRLTPEAKEQLSRLAEATHRTKSFLAAEAINRYVARESEIIEGIETGIADMKAGRVVPHDEAMARLEATIAAVERGERGAGRLETFRILVGKRRRRPRRKHRLYRQA